MGLLLSTYRQFFPPPPKFSADHIPDLSGRVVLITGGNSGIGFLSAKALLSKNAKVYLACRSKEKAENAIARLRTETGKDAIFLHLNLASLDSIKNAAHEFLKSEKELHILFNNAALMEPPIEQLTEDGYDMTIGTNVLGHYYLTQQLFPALVAVSRGVTQKKARVVTTSSLAAEITQKIDYSAFKDVPLRKEIGSEQLYYQSKYLGVVMSNEFSRRYKDQGICFCSCNPGHSHSGLQKTLPGIRGWIVRALLHDPHFGPLTQLYAATHENADDCDGAYFIPWARHGTVPPATQDPAEGKRLWDWLEAQVQ